MLQSSCFQFLQSFFIHTWVFKKVDDTPVTLDQIRDLIQPVTNRLDDLSGQVASIKKKKPNHLLDSADLKWRKEDKKMQYKAWSEAWDHCDKARDAANLGN